MIENDGPDNPRPGDDKRRRAQVVEECLSGLGKTWVASCFEEMSRAGRNVEGGWPGRLAEARALVLRKLTGELAARGFGPPTAAELASAPTIVNDHARTEWLRAGKAQRQAQRGPG